MKNLILFFCISIAIFSCKKEEEIPVLIDYTFNYTEPINNPSEALSLNCTSSQVEIFYLDEYLYSRSILNPTNPNQIAYLRRPFDDGECQSQIWTFDFKTGRTYKVSNHKVCKLDWSISNWIVFITDDNEIWKVRPNGNDLTKLLSDSGGFNNFVKCNGKGTEIMIEVPAITSFGTLKKIIDFEGNEIQILPALEFEYYFEMDWKNDFIAFPKSNKIGIHNIKEEETRFIDIDEHYQFTDHNNVQFLNQNEILWLHQQSIYKTNLDSEEKTLIKEYGENDFFIHMDISIDKKTILLLKQDAVGIADCQIQIRTYLALMDMDGSNERRILIPE